MVYRLCQAYQALPDVGGVLDQCVSILRMHVILSEAGYFEDSAAAPAPRDPFAGLPMEAL